MGMVGSVNRRDFFTFRSERRLRVMVLSCERLYMRFLDAQVTCAPQEDGSGGEMWSGEPPAVFERRTPEQLFDDIELDLHGIDVLRVADASWLTSEALRQRVDAPVAAFRARGGRVEFSDASPHRS